jgi:hypothetical protein
MRNPSREPLQHVRREAHRFLPSGDDDIRIAVRDRLRAEHRGLEPRTANLVDRHRGNHVGKARANRRLARGVLPDARGEHLPHDHLGHLIGLHARALQHLANDVRAKVRCRDLGDRAAEFADRGARCANDDDVFHVVSPRSSRDSGSRAASRSGRARLDARIGGAAGSLGAARFRP